MAGKKSGQREKHGNAQYRRHVRTRETTEDQLTAYQFAPVGNDALKALIHDAALDLLATGQGYGFFRFSETGKGKAEIGFTPLLFDIEPHQWCPEDMGHAAADEDINGRGSDHVMRNINGDAKQRQ